MKCIFDGIRVALIDNIKNIFSLNKLTSSAHINHHGPQPQDPWSKLACLK